MRAERVCTVLATAVSQAGGGSGGVERRRGAMNATVPKHMLRSTQYALDARVYDEDAIPPASLAAKREVISAKRPDILQVGKPSWNTSTVSENMYRFPDRPMMRTLAVYDSVKRADYNFRAETLDWRDKRVYEPVPNKFQVNRRDLGKAAPMLDAPPPLSRTEFPAHPALVAKPRWDPATGHGGDYYRFLKERDERLEVRDHRPARIHAAIAPSRCRVARLTRAAPAHAAGDVEAGC